MKKLSMIFLALSYCNLPACYSNPSLEPIPARILVPWLLPPVVYHENQPCLPIKTQLEATVYTYLLQKIAQEESGFISHTPIEPARLDMSTQNTETIVAPCPRSLPRTMIEYTPCSICGQICYGKNGLGIHKEKSHYTQTLHNVCNNYSLSTLQQMAKH